MTEGMACGLLGNPGAADGILHGPLENGFMEVVTATLPGETLHVEARGREDPLPPPVPAGVRVLARQGVGQLDPAGAATEVGLVLLARALEVGDQRGLDCRRNIVTRSLRPLPSRM